MRWYCKKTWPWPNTVFLSSVMTILKIKQSMIKIQWRNSKQHLSRSSSDALCLKGSIFPAGSLIKEIKTKHPLIYVNKSTSQKEPFELLAAHTVVPLDLGQTGVLEFPGFLTGRCGKNNIKRNETVFCFLSTYQSLMNPIFWQIV